MWDEPRDVVRSISCRRSGTILQGLQNGDVGGKAQEAEWQNKTEKKRWKGREVYLFMFGGIFIMFL